MSAKKTKKAVAADSAAETTDASFIKIDVNGHQVLSNTLLPGERKLNDTTTRYLANVPTTD